LYYSIFKIKIQEVYRLKILVACEESQAVTIELRALGHEAYSCDIVECSGGHPEWHLQQDVVPLLKEKWDMIIAFPPCTHLCNSGARWFASGAKPIELQHKAIEFFMLFTDLECPRVAIENPVGKMSTHYRKPDQIINPWMFGDTDNKKTCLWLKGLPLLKPTNVIPVEERTNNNWEAKFNGKSYSWNSPETAKHRSKTYPGIAKAMAIAWAGENPHIT